MKPPRLDGAKLGLFATRSPYRPAPIGLTLARIERIEGRCSYMIATVMYVQILYVVFNCNTWSDMWVLIACVVALRCLVNVGFLRYRNMSCLKWQ